MNWFCEIYPNHIYSTKQIRKPMIFWKVIVHSIGQITQLL